MNGRLLSSIHRSSLITDRCPVLAEVALIFAVFFVQGASPVPDVNEPYYLGKAIHFWNPDWVPGDFFLDSADTHKVFYFTFGWLSLWLSPTGLAWVGRVLTWGLLAWAWRRLSVAVVPRRWYSVLTAALLVCMIQWCHLAGEWVVGGVEAKGFAFVLVFLGLEALVRGRWNRVWLLLGAASAFHVLVGGWSIVAVALAWLRLPSDRPPLRSMWPAMLGGFLLSLPGLAPALALNWTAEAEVVGEANQIYVYGRLAHHLAPWRIPAEFAVRLVRFALLFVLWWVLCRMTPAEVSSRRLQAFVAAAVAIALVGLAIGPVAYFHQPLAAGLLRYYWFRLADVAVPLGVALGGASFTAWALRSRPAVGRRWLVIAIAVAAAHVGACGIQRPLATPPPANAMQPYADWRLACQWVAQSGQIPSDARFLTPRMARTFKWYARRSEVVNWKEIPQDAAAIVEWWRRLGRIHATGSDTPKKRWHESLAQLGGWRLKQLGREYGADYVLTAGKPRLPLKVLYRNSSYAVYQLRDGVLPGRQATDQGSLPDRENGPGQRRLRFAGAAPPW